MVTWTCHLNMLSPLTRYQPHMNTIELIQKDIKKFIMTCDYLDAEKSIKHYESLPLDTASQAWICFWKGVIDNKKGRPIESNHLSEALEKALDIEDLFLIYNIFLHLGCTFKLTHPMIGIFFLRESIGIACTLKSDELVFYANCPLATSLYKAKNYRDHTLSASFGKEAELLIDSCPTNKINNDEMQLLYDSSYGIVKQDIAKLQACAEKAKQMGYKSVSDNTLKEINIIKGLQETVKAKKPETPSTILDVLEELEYYNQVEISKNRSLNYSLFQNNFGFLPVKGTKEGYIKLFPNTPRFNYFYRGQSQYYKDCYPSLYRKDMIFESKRYLERLKLAELQTLIEKYHVYKVFNSTSLFPYRNGQFFKAKIETDMMAIAQHYGIKTEMIDITPSTWVAAFFATTYYDNTSQKYYPITDEDKEGVFYELDASDLTFKKNIFKIVGMQTFERPTRQMAMMLKMNEGENFDTYPNVYKRFFRHNKQANLFIYRFMNQSRMIFPNELIIEKINAIQNSKTFSKRARKNAINQYYKDIDENIIIGYEQEQQLSFVDYDIVTINKDEDQIIQEQWNRIKTDYINRILPTIPVYNI